jgi:hypothetical protein
VTADELGSENHLEGSGGGIYRLGGTGIALTDEKPEQVTVIGVGTHIKLIFAEQPKRTSGNPCGSVGLQMFRVYG